MLGLKIKRKSDGALYTVAGFDGALYSLAPVEFGSVIGVPLAELFCDWNVKPEQVETPKFESQIIRERDADANRTINQTYGKATASPAALKRARVPVGPPEGSPEAYFANLAQEGS